MQSYFHLITTHYHYNAVWCKLYTHIAMKNYALGGIINIFGIFKVLLPNIPMFNRRALEFSI